MLGTYFRWCVDAAVGYIHIHKRRRRAYLRNKNRRICGMLGVSWLFWSYYAAIGHIHIRKRRHVPYLRHTHRRQNRVLGV